MGSGYGGPLDVPRSPPCFQPKQNGASKGLGMRCSRLARRWAACATDTAANANTAVTSRVLLPPPLPLLLLLLVLVLVGMDSYT